MERTLGLHRIEERGAQGGSCLSSGRGGPLHPCTQSLQVEKHLAPDNAHGKKHIEIEGWGVLASDPLNYFMVRQRSTKTLQKLRGKEVLGMENCDLYPKPFNAAYRMPVDC
jgi:hypothetical protein